ncbi:hypothetical protein GUITHDRAFT_121488 [Guillardia theta CCMP2712]|uniref:C2 domain-containing protein n=1 Tax=Guillardia theta (strain CCMP2712) TaxID=905079 RepID=L1I8F3_GUITC|nr:hypothetical protein GUITHDRAFT_121488 [Guillardia theta CCMP2712]EKX32347.1 hypothetical protein GUITHDRAFT_121488 [Guillardia theta CCMP2712]|eukprot:XP_005819327.1 hypothetical protein GUITHDRAFT_121488 [Guillardia theta CCMP2712]
MAAAVVAATLNRQMREAEQEQELDYSLHGMLEDPHTFQSRMASVDSVLEDLKSKSLFGPTDDALKESESKIHALLEKVQARIDRSTRYRKLAGTSLFFLLFILLVFAQRDSQVLYVIESSLLDALVDDLPSMRSGGFMNSGVGATGYIRNNDDLYSWLQQSILPSVFQDPVCGDGVCDSPAEYPGFGRFGCIPDCGKYPNLTSVSLSLKDVIADSGALLGWDLTLLDSSLDPSRSKFTYNIYSDTMNAFVFEQDIDNATLSLELPDGQYTLVMYQTKQTTDLVDLSTMEHYLRLNANTIPEKELSNSLHYGDMREFLSSAILLLENIIHYCSKESSRTFQECQELNVEDLIAHFLDSYGLNGSVSMKDRRTKVLTPLLNIKFCSAPNLRNKTYAALKELFTSYQTSGCSDSNALRATQQSLSATMKRSKRPLQVLQDLVDAKNKHQSQRATAAGGTQQVGYTCSSHADCAASSFCAAWTVVAPSTSSSSSRPTNSASSSTFVCKPCALCTVDTRDSYDGVCPQDKCPGSGGFPPCVNASALLASFSSSCENHNHFDIWSYGSSSSGPPVVIPPFTPKVLEVTPFNRMVGALVVSQKRMQSLPTCVDHIQDPGLHNYTLLAQSSINCPSTSAQESTPFGFDPTFMPSSSLYNGELRADRFYGDSERHSFVDDSGQEVISYPYGFFPHRYDSNHLDLNMDGELTPDELARDVNGSDFSKSPAVVVSLEADNFKVYFDERLSRKQALDMLTSLQDGKFIDFQTKQVSVELMTYNAVRNILSYCQVTFTWDVGGKIPWEYKITTVGVDKIKHPSTWQLLLMLAILLALVINMGMEVTDILHHLRKFSASSYFTDPFNLIDWLHFAFLVGSVVSWLLLHSKARAFSLKVGYPILFYGPEYGSSRRVSSASSQELPGDFESPIAVTSFAKARRLRTNNQAEYDFLLLLDSVKAMASAEDMYAFFAGMSIVLFVFRMLKSLDFQERMGMVTRTIGRASSDLFHFLLLFMIVFLGYAIVGVFLFGHQYEGMSNLSSACKTLAMMLFNLDSTLFYSSLSHSSSDGAVQVFLWSYVFVVFFLLFNIFLAILVDAYVNVKHEVDKANGLLQDIALFAVHGARRVISPSSTFISDQQLEKLLKEKLEAICVKNVIQGEVNQHLAHQKAILLKGGHQIGPQQLGSLLGFQEAKEDEVEASATSLDVPVSENAAMQDVMSRYGEDVAELRDRRNTELKEIVGMENMRRLLAMNAIQIGIMEEQRRLIDLVEGIARKSNVQIPRTRSCFELFGKEREGNKRLNLTVLSASKLPKMDFFRSCDPYCVAYINGSGSSPSFRTSVVQRSTSPTWNEKFTWKLGGDTTILTITLWDKDNVSKDDLIGTVIVDLRSCVAGEARRADFQVRNPQCQAKLKDATLCLEIEIFEEEEMTEEDLDQQPSESPEIRYAPPRVIKDD